MIEVVLLLILFILVKIGVLIVELNKEMLWFVKSVEVFLVIKFVKLVSLWKD